MRRCDRVAEAELSHPLLSRRPPQPPNTASDGRQRPASARMMTSFVTATHAAAEARRPQSARRPARPAPLRNVRHDTVAVTDAIEMRHEASVATPQLQQKHLHGGPPGSNAGGLRSSKETRDPRAQAHRATTGIFERGMGPRGPTAVAGRTIVSSRPISQARPPMELNGSGNKLDTLPVMHRAHDVEEQLDRASIPPSKVLATRERPSIATRSESQRATSAGTHIRALFRLREAIKTVAKQQADTRGAGGIIGLVRKLRAVDVHPGHLVSRIHRGLEVECRVRPSFSHTASGLIRSTEYARASETVNSANPKRWPEVWAAFQRAQAAAARGESRAHGQEGHQGQAKGMQDSERSGLAATSLAERIHRETQALMIASAHDSLEAAAQVQQQPQRCIEAARQFDIEYDEKVLGTQRAVVALKYRFEVESGPSPTGYRQGLRGVFRHRYFVPEVYDPFAKPPPRRQPRRYRKQQQNRWRLEDSIWAPRRVTSNSKDFYETREALGKLLLIDWQVARMHHRLASVIVKWSACVKVASAMSQEAILESDHVAAVYSVLKRFAPTVYGAFYYYATMGKDWKGAKGDRVTKFDAVDVSLSQFYLFVSDCKLVPDEASHKRVTNVWSVVNAPDQTTIEDDPNNRKDSLNRHEWIQLLIRLAARTRLPRDRHENPTGNVAEAFEAFCNHMVACLPRDALLDGNEFRRRHCYLEEVDVVLREHEQTLRSIYGAYSGLGHMGREDHSIMASRSYLGLGEWVELLHSLGFVELGLLTNQIMLDAYQMSRIRSAKDHSHEQELKIRQLTFEDFLEALVRLAYVVPLPTDEELEETGALDAGDFILALYRDAPSQYRQFVARRTNGWTDAPRTRVGKSLAGLLSLIVRIIDANMKDPALGVDVLKRSRTFSRMQIAAFAQRRYHTSQELCIPAASFSGASIASVMKEIDAYNMKILSCVPAFSRLSLEQIRTLKDSMSVAKFASGEYVFEQGAEGNSFYLITSGYAEVLRVEPDDPRQEEISLALLHDSDCFGELALLHDAPRAASIQAASTLDVLYITRDVFESQLGPLSSYQLAEYSGVVYGE